MQFMTVRELANLLKVDIQTIYRKAKAGEIPCVRLSKNRRGGIRFDKDTITNWMLSNSNLLDK